MHGKQCENHTMTIAYNKGYICLHNSTVCVCVFGGSSFQDDNDIEWMMANVKKNDAAVNSAVQQGD